MMKAKKTKGELAHELATELRLLRSMVRDVGEGVILRKEGEVEALLGYLAGVPAARLKEFAPHWLREVRDLKVKPAKGRVKDLKKIDSLLEEMLDSVLELQQAEDTPHPRKKSPSRPKGRAGDQQKQTEEPLP